MCLALTLTLLLPEQNHIEYLLTKLCDHFSRLVLSDCFLWTTNDLTNTINFHLPRVQEIADTKTFWQEFHKTLGIRNLTVREKAVTSDEL